VLKFKIQLARIEVIPGTAPAKAVMLTFRFERREVRFEIPITLESDEFDDTELVQVARARLSEVFRQLAAQSAEWKLTPHAVATLAKLNRRRTAAS
jgi:hypothetical protein